MKMGAVKMPKKITIPTNNELRSGDFNGWESRSAQILQREGSSANDENRTIEAVITTEDPALVIDWDRWEYVDEILLADGAQIPESKQVPFLNCHSRYALSDILGSARGVKREDNNHVATLNFSSIEAAEDAWTLAREGHLTDVSIGYKIDDEESVYLEPETSIKINGKTYKNDGIRTLVIRKKWWLKEVSAVPIGADTKAKMRYENHIPEKEGNMPKEKNLPDTGVRSDPITPQQPVQPELAKVDFVKADPEAIRKEAAKLAARTEKAKDTLKKRGELLKLKQETVDEVIRSVSTDGIIDDDGEQRAIEAMFKKAEEEITIVSPKSSEARVSVKSDEFDSFRTAAIDSLCLRSGMKIGEEKEKNLRQSQYNGMGLLSTCRAFLSICGVRGAAYMSAPQVYESLVSNRHRFSGRSFATGTGDLANVFLDVANKSLFSGWDEEPTTYQLIAGTDEIPNFMTKNVIKISGLGEAEQIKEGEGFPYTAMSDAKETGALITIGLAWSLTRNAIINDDLSALTKGPSELAASIRRYVNRWFYTLLYGTAMAGPTMGEDGKAMFHTDHSNFVASGAGAAPGTATLSAGKTAMRKQYRLAPDDRSKKQYVGVSPSHILFHGDLEQAVMQQINSTYDPEACDKNSKNVNTPQLPFIRSLQPITDPVLDELMDVNSHKGWYLLANPAKRPAINVYSLTGFSSPTMRSKQSDVAEPLGTTWDIFYDCGVGPYDYRNAYANYGK